MRTDLSRVAVAAVREPLRPRARREAAYCLAGALTGLALFFPVIHAIFLVLLAPLLVVTGAARAMGAGQRWLATHLLGETVAAPHPVRRPGRRLGLGPRLRDPAGWKALFYFLLKPPLALLELYALVYWAGLAALTYPLWWRLFRSHPPGTHLRALPLLTPLGVFRIGSFSATTFAVLAGAAAVLAAPWVTRAVTRVDGWLVRRLLGPSHVSQRVADLELARTQVLDDADARLRQIERDLHDGAQVQLAALAMKLGQAKEKLEPGAGALYDPEGARGLLDDAHRHAKEGLAELRDLVRGIHPPVLDVGLDAALATLAARSAVPTALAVDLATRPPPALETIAYFSAGELLANVAKHSRAAHAWLDATARDGRLTVLVRDDGVGGARMTPGGGLAGLADRARSVDGTLRLMSPPGGPTSVTIELPMPA